MSKFFECQFCDYSNSDFYKYRAHCSVHYRDPNLSLTCYFCNINQPITGFRLLHTKCRLCVHLYRYRFGKTKNIYPNYLNQINANIQSVSQTT